MGRSTVNTTSEQVTPVTYRDWSIGYGEPRGEEYGEAEARRRHEAGETYTVLVGNDSENPDVVIEVEPNLVTIEVTWLDELKREVFSEIFARSEIPGRDVLLMEQVHFWTYEPGTRPPAAEKVTSEAFFIHPDRKLYGSRELTPGVVEKSEKTLSEEEFERVYIEPLPEFGKWESLIRRDRDVPVVLG